MGSGIEGAGLILPWRGCGHSGLPQGFFQFGDSSPRLLEFLLQRGDPCGGFLQFRPPDVVSSARAIFSWRLRVRRFRCAMRRMEVLYIVMAVGLFLGSEAELEVVRVVWCLGGRGAQRHHA